MKPWWVNTSSDVFPIWPTGRLNETKSILRNEEYLAQNVMTACKLNYPVFRDPAAYISTSPPRDPYLIWDQLSQTSLFRSSGSSRADIGDVLRTGGPRSDWLDTLLRPTIIATCVVFVCLLPWPLLSLCWRYKKNSKNYLIQEDPLERKRAKWYKRFCWFITCGVFGCVIALCITMGLFMTDFETPACTASKTIYETYYGSFNKMSAPSFSWRDRSSGPTIEAPSTVSDFPGLSVVSPFIDQLGKSFKDLSKRDIILSSPEAALRIPWSSLEYTDAALSDKPLNIWHEGPTMLHHRLAGQLYSSSVWSLEKVYKKHLELVNAIFTNKNVPKELHDQIELVVKYGETYTEDIRKILESVLTVIDSAHRSMLHILDATYGPTSSSLKNVMRLVIILLPSCALGITLMALGVHERISKHVMKARQYGTVQVDNLRTIACRNTANCLSKFTNTILSYIIILLLVVVIASAALTFTASDRLASSCNEVSEKLFKQNRYHQYSYIDKKLGWIDNPPPSLREYVNASALSTVAPLPDKVDVFDICLNSESIDGNLLINFSEWIQWNTVFKRLNDLLVESSEMFGQDMFMVFGRQTTLPDSFVKAVDNMVADDWGLVVPDIENHPGLFVAGGPIVWASWSAVKFQDLEDSNIKQSLSSYVERWNKTDSYKSLDNQPVWAADELRFYSPEETTAYFRNLVPESCEGRDRICMEWDILCLTEVVSNGEYPISIGHKTLPYIKEVATEGDEDASMRDLIAQTRDKEVQRLLRCVDSNVHRSRNDRIEFFNTLYLSNIKSIILADERISRHIDTYLADGEAKYIELCHIGQLCHLYHIQSGPYTNIVSRSSYLRKLQDSLQQSLKMDNQQLAKIFINAYTTASPPMRLWKSVDRFQEQLDCRILRKALVDIHGSVCNRVGPSSTLLAGLWTAMAVIITFTLIKMTNKLSGNEEYEKKLRDEDSLLGPATITDRAFQREINLQESPGRGSHAYEEAKARAKIENWEEHADDRSHVFDPSPVTVGDMQAAAFRKNPESERDKGVVPSPNEVLRYFDPAERSRTQDPKYQAKYDPIGFPEVSRRGHQGTPDVLRDYDPLTFESRTGFVEDPNRRARADYLTGPDGVQDDLRDIEINNRMMMGNLPPHRGMPSPIPPNAPTNDIRGLPRDLFGSSNQRKGFGGPGFGW